jgi:hypothetical protein
MGTKRVLELTVESLVFAYNTIPLHRLKSTAKYCSFFCSYYPLVSLVSGVMQEREQVKESALAVCAQSQTN